MRLELTRLKEATLFESVRLPFPALLRMCTRTESDGHQIFRKDLLYPLSYGCECANFTIVKREFSAGGLVRKGNLWLVRRPMPNPEYRGNLGWSFPKGWVDEGENLEQAAIREVKEEGGVVAKVIKKLSTLKIFFRNKGELVMKFITYFVMGYIEDASEGFGEETAEAKWVTKEEALKLLVHKNERELLEKIEE